MRAMPIGAFSERLRIFSFSAKSSRTASFQLLQSVDEIGKKRSEALMAQYGSLEAVLKKDPEDLAKEAKLPLAVAQRLIKQLSL